MMNISLASSYYSRTVGQSDSLPLIKKTCHNVVVVVVVVAVGRR